MAGEIDIRVCRNDWNCKMFYRTALRLVVLRLDGTDRQASHSP